MAKYQFVSYEMTAYDVLEKVKKTNFDKHWQAAVEEIPVEMLARELRRNKVWSLNGGLTFLESQVTLRRQAWKTKV